MNERTPSQQLIQLQQDEFPLDLREPISRQTQEFSHVVEQIYQGSTDPTRWKHIMEVVCQWVGSEKSVLFTPTLLPSMGGFESGYNLTDRILATRNEWGHQDPSAIAATEKGLFREGEILLDTDLVPCAELIKTEAFQTYFGEDDIAQMLACVIFGLDSVGVPPLVFCQYRGQKALPFGEVEKERMRLLLPHLTRSLGLMIRICESEIKTAASLSTLNKLTRPVLLLNQDSHVCFANAAALRLLDSGDGLELVGNPAQHNNAHLRVTSSVASHNLVQECISSAIHQNLWSQNDDGLSLAIQRPSGKPPYVVQVSALPAQNDLLIPTNRARVIVFITDPAKPVSLNLDLLSSVYGITPAEARVAEHLVNGDTVKEVARECGVSVNTVQTQVRRLYEKAGTNTRGQFVRLMQTFITSDNDT